MLKVSRNKLKFSYNKKKRFLVNTEESLFLLATAYFRNGQKDHAYYTLKGRTGNSSQCRYLLGICAYELEK